MRVGKVLGIDEAGRGAVLGPLVVAGVCVAEEDLPGLWEVGARDSKRVPRGERCALVRAIARSGVRARAVVVPAAAVNQENLTSLERDAALRIASALSPDRIVMDTPVGPRAIPKFRDSLSARSGLPPEGISVVPKADRDHPAVAAASLLAKVVRDGYVVALRRQFGDFGWGYPGEAKVQRYLASWLADAGTLPPICRTRWRGVQVLLSPQSTLHPSRIQGRMGEIAVRGREGGTHAQAHLPTPSSAPVPRPRVPGPQADTGRTGRARPAEEQGTAPADAGVTPGRGGA